MHTSFGESRQNHRESEHCLRGGLENGVTQACIQDWRFAKRLTPLSSQFSFSLALSKGGGLFEFQTPPKFSNPSFSNLRFWGKGLAPKAPKIFFLPFLRGYIFFFTLCVHTQNAQNFVENSKMFEKHRKFFDP